MSTCRYYGKCAGACDGHGLCVSFRNVTYYCESFEPMPDVDALLELADEMEAWALTCDHYDRRVAPIEVSRYAHRIREALGVES